MSTDQETQTAQPGAPALLLGRDRKTSLIRLEPGAEFHTHRGTIAHDDLIGLPWGTQVETHLGIPLLLLRPSTDDLVRNLERSTQIVYPKDAGYILMKLSIAPGSRVIEAGTGSGGLTAVFARAVQPTGQVIHLIDALESADFGLVDVEELLLRPYKTVSARLRPKDRLAPHTGYLIFARKLIPLED